jgi:TPR repeat protein
MWRTSILFLLPSAFLLAGVAVPQDSVPLSGQDRLDMAAVPIAQDLADLAAAELAKLRMAAEQGDLDAQTKIGVMYYWGQGAPLDWKEAQRWLRVASERGSRDAQAKLGAMYFLGQGSPKDLHEAVRWFRASAEQGEPYAQGCMGAMYATGEGVRQDLLEAYVWLVQAKAGGDDDADDPLQKVKSHLSVEQIQEGDRRAQEAIRMREAR